VLLLALALAAAQDTSRDLVRPVEGLDLARYTGR
jgi:hypothetical protein